MPSLPATRYTVTISVTAKFGQSEEQMREEVGEWLEDLKDYYCKVTEVEVDERN